MTQAELINLLRDCLTLWDVQARVQADEGKVRVVAEQGAFEIAAAAEEERPARWHLQTPARAEAGREPRRHPSIGALLSALRNEFGANVGYRLRVSTA